MTFEDTIRQVVREEIRSALQDLAPQRTATTGPEYLRFAEAAVHARVSPSTIREWVQTGKLNRYGEGRTPLVRRDELDRALAAQKPKLLSDADLEARAEQLTKKH